LRGCIATNPRLRSTVRGYINPGILGIRISGILSSW
jgi:hypothetical protein